MTDLIKQIEAKIDEMAQQECYSPSGDEIYFAHPQAFKAGATALMPLIEKLIEQRNDWALGLERDEQIQQDNKELLELLNKDDK